MEFLQTVLDFIHTPVGMIFFIIILWVFLSKITQIRHQMRMKNAIYGIVSNLASNALSSINRGEEVKIPPGKKKHGNFNIIFFVGLLIFGWINIKDFDVQQNSLGIKNNKTNVDSLEEAIDTLGNWNPENSKRSHLFNEKIEVQPEQYGTPGQKQVFEEEAFTINYTLQVGTFNNLGDAISEKKRLEQTIKESIYLEMDDSQAQPQYKVLVSGFLDRSVATKMAQHLKSKGIKCFVRDLTKNPMQYKIES